MLIVEDETLLRGALATFFESRGLEVTQAGSVGEALRALEEVDFDAVVLDVGLPDGDGLSLLPQIDAERSIVITANPDPERFKRCGVLHHLEKPLDLRELMQTVDTLSVAA